MLVVCRTISLPLFLQYFKPHTMKADFYLFTQRRKKEYREEGYKTKTWDSVIVTHVRLYESPILHLLSLSCLSCFPPFFCPVFLPPLSWLLPSPFRSLLRLLFCPSLFLLHPFLPFMALLATPSSSFFLHLPVLTPYTPCTSVPPSSLLPTFLTLLPPLSCTLSVPILLPSCSSYGYLPAPFWTLLPTFLSCLLHPHCKETIQKTLNKYS